MKLGRVLAGLSVFAAYSGHAANFGFVGAGARASGMGGAFIAVADDATAIFWNPGGLTHLLQPEVSFVGRLDSSGYKFPSLIAYLTPASASAVSVNFASAAYNFKAIGNRHVAVAASFSSLYDFDQNLKIENSDGSISDYKDRGKLSQIAVGGAIDVVPGFFLGTALYYHKGVIVTDQTNAGANGTTNHVDWSLDGNPLLGFGFFWDITAKLHAGGIASFGIGSLNYRGDQTITAPSGAVTRASGSGTFGLPGTVGVGVSWNPTENLVVAGDYRVARWGLYEENGTKPLYSNGKPKYGDSAQIHVGAEYFFPQNPLNEYPWPWRFGVYTDPSGNLTTAGAASYNATYFTAGTSLITDFGDISVSGEFGTKYYAPTSVGSAEESVFRLILSVIYRL